MEKRNPDIDFIQIYANIVDGKFFKRVYHTLWFGQKVMLLPRLSPQSFSKVFPQRIKKDILNRAMEKVTIAPFGGTHGLADALPIGSLVAGTFEAVLFYERLKHV